MTEEPTAEFVWDWWTEHDSYGVRRGDEIICLTNRECSGYERAKLIAAVLNAAEGP